RHQSGGTSNQASDSDPDEADLYRGRVLDRKRPFGGREDQHQDALEHDHETEQAQQRSLWGLVVDPSDQEPLDRHAHEEEPDRDQGESQHRVDPQACMALHAKYAPNMAMAEWAT